MTPLKLALPKGRMSEGVFKLLDDAGFKVLSDGRNYRPLCRDARFEIKLLKPQDIVRLVELGRHDLAFAGFDWIQELNATVDELLDTELDSVRIVAAAPKGSLVRGRQIVVASEYERITRNWLDAQGYDYLFLRSHGSTEVLPPEDADMIVDNTATGKTLFDNGLEILDTLMSSSTRIIARPGLRQSEQFSVIEEFLMLVNGVLDARKRVMLEMNVRTDCMASVLAMLPCMQKPTVMALADNLGYAVKSAVPKKDVARLIPMLKTAGATDLLEYSFSKVVL